MCHQTTHIQLWIDPDSEPICGWVAAGDRERQEFAGWVELTAAIESARLEPSHSASRSAERR
jgi:hypothetical protein